MGERAVDEAAIIIPHRHDQQMDDSRLIGNGE
jgi:hypothetical protein